MPDHFQPTWRRGLAAGAVAAAAFFLPQEVPLEYYPLNNPSSGLHYLEITCAASAEGGVRINLDYGNGINELDSIYWPISPTTRPYTYTFPLKDAPIHELRITPLTVPGELTITNFRIHNRRDEEIRRFTRGDFIPLNQIADIPATDDGWKLITTPDATEASVRINLPQSFAPEGMSERNLKRVLLSWSYLAMMLWIILLAVYFTLLDHRNKRAIATATAFLAFLSLTFSATGNRGLIRESVRSARFVPAPAPPGLHLELDLRVDRPGEAQLFWDTGADFNEPESVRKNYEPQERLQTLSLPLPNTVLNRLRFDPVSSEVRLELLRLRVVDGARFTRVTLPVDAFDPAHDIARIEATDDRAIIQSTPGTLDPILLFKPSVVEAINRQE